MQPDKKKLNKFKESIGKTVFDIRKNIKQGSLNKFAHEYDINKGTMSRLERGLLDCQLSTAWRIAEGAGIKFSEFAKRLEENLGDDFKLMDE